MYIGYAKNAKYSYKYAETDVAILPEITEDDVIGWKWETLYSIGLDIHVELEDESYVGAFTLPFKPKGRSCGVGRSLSHPQSLLPDAHRRSPASL